MAKNSSEFGGEDYSDVILKKYAFDGSKYVKVVEKKVIGGPMSLS